MKPEVIIEQDRVFVREGYGERLGPMNFLEARQLIQDLIQACFAVTNREERDQFVQNHPEIKCGDKLPGALSAV